ncbi:MAG: AAA family ATPase [Anaerolineales bacterium]|nr:AAA family ATPase [Anaerolineales bacterium]MCB8992274.1 AAA family ATPase [Ardenticatenaceae bacterium]
MRLIEFHPLAPYRNLPPRPIRFTIEPEQSQDNACSIRFLVGPNGVGKTNLLRFLADIFLALEENYRGHRGDSPAYSVPYRLIYQLHGETITIRSNGEGRSGVRFTLNGEAREEGDIPARDRILPQTLMVFTSGDPAPWQSLFSPLILPETDPDELDDFDDETLRREEEQVPQLMDADELIRTSQQVVPSDSTPEDELSQRSPRRSYFTRQEQLPFALLAALLHHQAHPENSDSPFIDILADVNVRLISFTLRYLPNVWALYPSQRRLLRRLFDLATITVQEGDEQVWVFDLNEIKPETGQTTLANLSDDPLHEPFQFFQALVEMAQKGIFNGLDMVVNYRPPGRAEDERRTLLTQHLSDGELAFLSRMALIYLLRDDECLFFLDEPETHFNDDWKRNLVDSIERALQQTNSEVILTSHASIVLTDAFSDEIILLTHDGQEPIVPLTFAAEQGEPLRMVFGSERSVGRRAMRRVEAAIASGSAEELERLLQQVGPGYYRFQIVKELQRRVPPDQSA